MLSIRNLFEDEDRKSVPKKYRSRVQKKCHHFKGFEESLPELSHPQENTSKFEEDLDEVRRCVRNPSLSKKFLKKSHKKSEDIFKKLLKKEDVDWKKLDEILDEFDGVVTRLKFVYDRKRPYFYFKERDEDIETKEVSSPAFPSGHAAFAYFTCDYLSNIVPHRKRELEKLAELICQSRIENGVHFPSDIAAGRFVGEQAASFLNSSIQENANDRSTQKTFVRFLRKRSREIRPKFSKKECFAAYSNDMSIFISESTGASIQESYDASRNFLAGYRFELCTENKEIVRLFEGMCHAFFNSQSCMKDIVLLNKILEEESTVRLLEKSTLSGVMFSPVKKIEEFCSKISKFNNKPFVKLAAVNWISPFKKGNKKITNIIFLKESGFNFDITNQILCNDLPKILENFYLDNDMEKLFS